MPVGWVLLFWAAPILVLIALVVMVRSGAWKRYPFLLLYLVLGLAGQASNLLVLTRTHETGSRAYAISYWTSDLVLHGLVIVLLLFLMRQARHGSSGLDRVGLLILATVALLVAFAIYMLLGPTRGWITPLSRLLSFCEALLNLVLWTILIRDRSRDVVLFLVSAGLGIQVTGEVIGRTLRLATGSPLLAEITNALVLICETGALLIWCRAFLTYGRLRAAERKAEAARGPHGGA